MMRPQLLKGKKNHCKVSARVKVVDLLSRREHSQFEVKQKLLARGYEQTEVNEALAWAITLDLQSDSRFQTSLFRRRSSNYGDKAIEFEFVQHGIKSTLAKMPDEDILSEEERAYQWLLKRNVFKDMNSKHTGENEQQLLFKRKAKAFKSLSARGFQFNNIEKAWQRIVQEQCNQA